LSRGTVSSNGQNDLNTPAKQEHLPIIEQQGRRINDQFPEVSGDGNLASLPILLISPPESKGSRYGVPIQITRVFQLIPPPLVGVDGAMPVFSSFS
jgi:hypothetical protein